MIFLDGILTSEEKETISEVYWACRFGHVLVPLLENNPDYPNLKAQHTIEEEVGRKAMESLDPVAVPFWHFRPDFPRNYQVGLELFGLKSEDVQAIDTVGCFEILLVPMWDLLLLKMPIQLNWVSIFCFITPHLHDLDQIFLLLLQRIGSL